VVRVDNKRYANEVPTLNTDWWNYGGITREVKLVELPAKNAIQDYVVQLNATTNLKNRDVTGWVKISNASTNEKLTVEIPELKVKQTFVCQQWHGINQPFHSIHTAMVAIEAQML